jgi:hypothetical protein
LRSAPRYSISNNVVVILLAAAAPLAGCRKTAAFTETVADGASIAPFANPDTYVPRLQRVGMQTLLVPWVDGSIDLGALRGATDGSGLELILGLDPARSIADEWNAPGTPPDDLEAALDRALSIADGLAGVHLDHAQPGLPDDAFAGELAATVQKIRARTSLPLSFAIRARALTADQIAAAPPTTAISAIDSETAAAAWANAWSAALAGSVDRVLVVTENAAKDDVDGLAQDLSLLRRALPAKTELWASLDALSATTAADAGITAVRPARLRDRIAIEAVRLRPYASRVLVHGTEAFMPDDFLTETPPTRTALPAAVDVDLEARANDADARLRRCCMRDGQILPLVDQRFERDRDGNMWQEDACWMTGLYGAAMSFRFAATMDAGALDEAREAWRALHQMANTTPLKGEVVRTFSRHLYGSETEPPMNATTMERWYRARDRETYWIGDESIEQLSGWFLGASVYHDLVASDDEKAQISADVAAILDEFLAHDLHAMEFTGRMTTDGDLRSAPVLALAFFQIGFHITQDVRYRTELENLMDTEGMHLRIASGLSAAHAAGMHAHDHLYASGFYPLLMYESDIARRAALEPAFQVFAAAFRRFGDARSDIVYAVFHTNEDTARRATRELAAYRPELTSNAAWLAAFSDIPAGPFVTIGERPGSELDFDYVPPGKQALRGGLEERFSGVGYLLSYWMGRYHGLLPLTENMK